MRRDERAAAAHLRLQLHRRVVAACDWRRSPRRRRDARRRRRAEVELRAGGPLQQALRRALLVVGRVVGCGVASGAAPPGLVYA